MTADGILSGYSPSPHNENKCHVTGKSLHRQIAGKNFPIATKNEESPPLGDNLPLLSHARARTNKPAALRLTDKTGYLKGKDQIMPARSKAQQRAAGAALAAKRGETDPADLKGASAEMYETMDEAALIALAATEHDGLPEKIDDDS